MISARTCAAGILAEVLTSRKYLDHILDRRLDPEADGRDRALTRELCYGTLRWYYRYDAILGKLLKKPLKAGDTNIRMLIMCGLYQIDFLRIPDHAAIADTVEAARQLKKPWAVPLINAVLRRYQRERDSLAAMVNESAQSRYAHPAWLIETVREQWPDHFETILDSNNRRPPLHLRVNLARLSRDDYLGMLQNEGIEARPTDLADSGVHVLTPMDVDTLPGFQSGLVSVQDAGAQLAARLLDTRPGQRILDACAAPGGKTGHIAETEPELTELVAVENDPHRTELLQRTTRRLALNAKVICSDIIHKEHWWDKRAFDRILLDVPCSATGVIRRHPDIKLLRTPEQVKELADTQRRILEAVWPMLAAGGKLLYVTCSVLREEGSMRIDEFLKCHTEAVAETLSEDHSIPAEHGMQLLPGVTDTDGFYYSRLSKTG